MSINAPLALIVEDRPEIADLWKYMCSRLGMTTLQTDSLHQAVLLSQKIPPPDLILLDLVLIDSDPDNTISNIKLLKDCNPNVLIFVVSGVLTPEIIEQALAAGAHGVKEKMELARSADLWSMITSALDKAPAGARAAMEFSSQLISQLQKTQKLAHP